MSTIEDSGFTNVEQVITKLLSSLHEDVPRQAKVQIKITNLDKKTNTAISEVVTMTAKVYDREVMCAVSIMSSIRSPR